MGKILMAIGGLIFLAGAAWTVLDRLGLGRFFGRLPGDIHVVHGNTTFDFPIGTCIVLSIVLSILLNVFFRH